MCIYYSSSSFFFFLLTYQTIDFDLCHSCFSIVKQNHPEQHQFTTHLAGAEFNRKQKKQYSDVVVASPPCDVDVPVQHAGVRCDYCQSQVVSIRYKVVFVCSSFASRSLMQTLVWPLRQF